MKKSFVLLAIIFLTVLPFSVVADAYDGKFVVENMRANVARIGAIKAAVGAGDFGAAAKAFYDYGNEAGMLQKMDPPKGSKDEWVKIWVAFQDTAFKGVGACGERDAEKALKLLDEIVALNKPGHESFR